ncbi:MULTISPECIES: site-specific DNA-methyltransferase [Burkholderia]|uniref:site-specific DNA-methyltransferase n=1 Tax=Burkholderia TaxID=32008 RepID=UPI0009761DF0|nr:MULTISPECIES: site-specific DNA-methyltransferase [pseudomallei group]MCS3400803.1 site-specific DNA-methyltransferase [Burkholderia thailandensis]ONE84274.1 DNA methylase [Burkholderia pseudomallei]QIO13410.1 site-specific DNA-methyltransferase [Burkholderia thailandensis]CAJ3291250.1 adenine-specific DNA-methyltransferase [Burkholderia pseudomallei]CAJ9426025.1 adenine-specific DNA-methyltransferase [Burkholderia pseudomallei]
MAKKLATQASKVIEDLVHNEAKRKNIPTVEHQSVMQHHEQTPVKVKYPRGGRGLDEEKAQRNRDLDPQLVWRGKDQQDWSDLVVNAPPLYIQEKVKPKVLIDDLRRVSEAAAPSAMGDLFGDFNGLPDGADRTEFYQHEGHWQNRMILGDSLQVMASLAEREGLRGKVQCIYFDPPYGIKFNSNFQWSTTSRDVRDGNAGHITREPEQVKAFRDTWRDGIHSYLTYLRDRLMVARDLLTESGSIFVQIGDENLYLVKALLVEVFGEANYVNTIAVKKKGSTLVTESMFDFIVWFCKKPELVKVRRPIELRKSPEEDTKFNTLMSVEGELVRATKLASETIEKMLKQGWSWARVNYPIVSQHPHEVRSKDYLFRGRSKKCGRTRQWSFDNPAGLDRLAKAGRLFDAEGESLAGVVRHDDRPAVTIGNLWDDVKGEEDPIYVVQTAWRVVQRCLLMTTDPGDLVLDPTCGSGTTAYVAEQWGRRWITIDTSRVALALARARIMGARYPFYLLADSREGQQKEAEITRSVPSSQPVYGNITHGFVCERVPHITLKSIANNAEIDVIWDKFEQTLGPLREQLNKALEKNWQEWEIPRAADAEWGDAATKLHADWWQQRIARQKEIDASIAARAEFEFLYDKPYEDRKRVRVAGPFTVESLSPHRVLGVDEADELIDGVAEDRADYGQDFTSMILTNLRTAGVQQKNKDDKIEFSALEPWPGEGYVVAVGTYLEGDKRRRAGIFVGPEFGTVSRADLVDAAREAGDAGFDVLIACAFSYDAPASEFSKLGRINVLKARMNADLHMADDLKNTGKGNLFVIFGEPDVDVLDTKGNSIRKYNGKRDIIEVPAGEQLVVKIRGVDVFDPSTGEVRSDDPDGIACWFLDTDYNEESFFVRHAYFLGANDPYKALKSTLKAEIDADAWATLNSDTSRPFPKPSTGRFAVKVINHLGDEVMKVFKVG